MAKKKKPAIDPKVQKAQYRNNYLRELKKYYDQIHPDLYGRLNNLEREILFMCRGTVVRTVGDGSRVPVWMLRYCDDFIRHYMHISKIDIIPGKFSVSLMEYSIYFIPIEACSEEYASKFTDSPWYTEIILNNRETRISAFESYMNMFSILLMHNLSQPARQLCYVEYKMQRDHSADGLTRVSQHYKLRGCNPSEVRIVFDNKEARTAIELLYNYSKFDNPDNIPPFTPLTILPSRFGIETGEEEEKPYPAFILRHALHRMDERLSCIDPGYAGTLIVDSLLHGEVHHRSKDGKMLVEYKIDKCKAGYLHVEVREGIILVRTFLFLTNASTPEGIKLRSHLKLQKEDIKYFNLDKLAPLMESDLLSDEEMCNKLREAGCESLIELCEAVKECPYSNLSEEKRELAAILKNYMMEESEETSKD